MMTAPETEPEQIKEIVAKLPSSTLIEVGALMAILNAGASNDLAPEQKTDIAKAWLRLYYYSAVTDIIRLIMETAIKEKLDMEELRKFIGTIGMNASEERDKLGNRAILLSETLLPPKKEHAKK